MMMKNMERNIMGRNMGQKMDENVQHLTLAEQTNMGSFYTPSVIVERLYEMLERLAPAHTIDVLLEPSCGYGAFLKHRYVNNAKRVIGADIDIHALSVAKTAYNGVEFVCKNALYNVTRKAYGIGDHARLAVVGNPPYNDTTSQAKNALKQKAGDHIDSDIFSRDLGLSSLLAYNKLQAEYIAVLHPLSYLIKRTNFRVLSAFAQNYTLNNALVFSSQLFAATSKSCGFPLLIAIYKRDYRGMKYDDIYHFNFQTLEGENFALSQFDYITNYIAKYHNRRSKSGSCDYLFYTMRDINALKRSRTFIAENIPNAVHIEPAKLDYYCYVDIFKDYAVNLPYYMGNLDVPIDHTRFEPLRSDFRRLSVAKHRTIFADRFAKTDSQTLKNCNANVSRYFAQVFGTYKKASAA